MSRKIFLLIACLFFSVLVSGISLVSAISNPANVYCNELGYEYEVIRDGD